MNTSAQNKSIAIVDDDQLMVQLLNDFLSSADGFNVCITAQDGGEFIEKIKDAESLPDVVILDLRMKGMDGIETLEQLKKIANEIRIIVLSSHYKKSFMGYMLRSGVNAFLPKGVMPQVLLQAINEVFEKGFFFLKEQVDAMRSQVAANAPAPVVNEKDVLTGREREVLKLICQQFTSKQIAEKLFLSQRTVEGHKSNLLLKTGAKNVAGLVIYAVQNEVVDVDECIILTALNG